MNMMSYNNLSCAQDISAFLVRESHWIHSVTFPLMIQDVLFHLVRSNTVEGIPTCLQQRCSLNLVACLLSIRITETHLKSLQVYRLKPGYIGIKMGLYQLEQ